MPIAHTGGCACIRIYIDRFDMDIRHPIVTSNRMLNYLSDHHKVCCAYIRMYILKHIMHYHMCYMDIGENF